MAQKEKKIKIVALKSPYHKAGHILEMDETHANHLIEKGYFEKHSEKKATPPPPVKSKEEQLAEIEKATTEEEMKALSPKKDADPDVKKFFGEKMKSLSTSKK